MKLPTLPCIRRPLPASPRGRGRRLIARGSLLLLLTAALPTLAADNAKPSDQKATKSQGSTGTAAPASAKSGGKKPTDPAGKSSGTVKTTGADAKPAEKKKKSDKRSNADKDKKTATQTAKRQGSISGKSSTVDTKTGGKKGKAQGAKRLATAATAAAILQSAEQTRRTQEHMSTFEQGPGVLGVSMHTRRREQLKEYASEPVGEVALGLQDLRLTPINKGDRIEVNLANSIPFEGKGDKIGTKAQHNLDLLARVLAAQPLTRVTVLVYVTDQGQAHSNLSLSQKAAEAVKASLVGRGLAAERLVAVGRGEAAPLVAATGKHGPTRADRTRNRRVELVIEPLTPPSGTAAGAAAPVEPPASTPPAEATVVSGMR